MSEKITCKKCISKMKYYDKVVRTIKSKNRKTKSIEVKRFRCPVCGSVLRVLPNYIFPYKQYEAEIILGVIEGFITSDTIGFEDYPCETTMLRWMTEFSL